eukprot:Trichotokara_eunicae@DN5831_c0_g1_i1.p1
MFDCGGFDNPCPVAHRDMNCDQCYKIMMQRPSLVADYCFESECPPFYSEIYVKVIDWSRSITFSIPETAWNVFCPNGCEGSSLCFDFKHAQESQCAEDDFIPPCTMGPHIVSFFEVPCGN